MRPEREQLAQRQSESGQARAGTEAEAATIVFTLNPGLVLILALDPGAEEEKVKEEEEVWIVIVAGLVQCCEGRGRGWRGRCDQDGGDPCRSGRWRRIE